MKIILAPLKGIPSRTPSSGFRSPTLTPSSMANRTPLNNRIRKDGGIKLLDINEQPLGYQAKKRKRQLELEEQNKKAADAQAVAAVSATTTTTTTPVPATPEYAQGLAPINPPSTLSTTPTVVPQSYTVSTTTTAVPIVSAAIAQRKNSIYDKVKN